MNSSNRFHRWRDRLRRPYRVTAYLVFNTLLILVGLNLLLGIVYYFKDRAAKPKKSHQQIEDYGEVTASGLFYTNGAPVDNGKRRSITLRSFDILPFEGVMPEEEIAKLLDEQWEFLEQGIEFEPWVLFANSPYEGEFINYRSDSLGFPIRHTPNPAPQSEKRVVRIFAFGGSTTFGSGVADGQTWAAYLSGILNEQAWAADLPVTVEVFNYGRNAYTPTQEMVLLLDLLRSGHRPDLAIFMDGVNWGNNADVPPSSARVARQMREIQGKYKAPSGLPMFRFINSLRNRLNPPPAKNRLAPNDSSGAYSIDHIVDRFVQCQQTSVGICDLYSVDSLFFLQPTGMYNYPKDLYRFTKPDFFDEIREDRIAFHQKMMERDEYIDLSHLFAEFGENRKALIDTAHYSPNFNQFLAEAVARSIDISQLASSPAPTPPFGPTGRR